MDILNWMKGSTPEQCREVALLMLEQGTKERTAQWHANIDAAIAEQRTGFEIRDSAE